MMFLPVVIALAAALVLAAPAAAQEPAVEEITESFYVPTVGGAQVYVHVRRPTAGKVPVILTYSPYNVLHDPESGPDEYAARYLPKGYARAFADVLGTRNSSGCWDYGGPREQRSGVDLVNFLASQPWSTGRVAMIGGSYDGATAMSAATHSAEAPGLAAVVPISAVSRWYGYAYFGGVRYFGNSDTPTDEGFDTPLAFDYGLGRVPPTSDPANAQAWQDRLNPCDSVAHTERGYDTTPDYDAFWLERDYRKDADKVRVPTLVAHGWQDYNVKQEEGLGFYSAVSHAPWKGLWMYQDTHNGPQGPAWEATLDAFLDRYLLGKGAGLPERGLVVSQPRDSHENGTLQMFSTWPPQLTGDIELRLGRGDEGGVLGPSTGEPASYTDRGMTEEAIREDLAAEMGWLAYVSEPAASDSRIAGSPALDLTLEVDRDHGHLTPILLDIDEDESPTVITRGFLNLAYRDGLSAGKPVEPGAAFRAVVNFLPQDWIVRKGHRIGLAIASSNTVWAVPDRPGLNVEISHGPSRLLLPVVGAGRAELGGTLLPGGQQPAEALLTSAEARARLRVRLRVTQRKGRRPAILRVTGRAPSRTSVYVRLLRGGRAVSDQSARARRGRFKVNFRVRRRGTYRVLVMMRTREGVISRRSGRVRVR